MVHAADAKPEKGVFLTTARKRFQSSFDAFSPVVRLNAEGSIQELSVSAKRLLEYAPGEAVEPCFFTHVHSKNLYQVMRDVADMVMFGKKRASWLVRMRTGRRRWQWYKASVLNGLAVPGGAIVIELSTITPTAV